MGYLQYTQEFASVAGMDVEEVRSTVKTSLIAAAGIAPALIVAEAEVHKVDAADAAAHVVGHGFYLGEAFATFGISILASLGVGWLLKNLNRKKVERLVAVSERAWLNSRLSMALMTSGCSDAASDTLDRIRELGV